MLRKKNSYTFFFRSRAVPDQCWSRMIAGDPDFQALWWPNGALTYAQLTAVVEERGLEILGALANVEGDDVVVAVDGETSVDVVIAELASNWAGVAFAPLGTATGPRLAELLASLKPAVILTSAVRIAEFKLIGVRCQLLVCRPPGVSAGEAGADGVTRIPRAPPDTLDRCAAKCFSVFTSGTTGTPKRIDTLCGPFTAYLDSAAARYSIGPGVRVLLASASVFDPSIGDVFMTLSRGGTLCVVPWDELTADLPGSLVAARATHVCTTPALWSLMAGVRPVDLPELRTVVLGGEPMTQQTVETWASGVELVNTYGVTEAVVYQAAYTIPAETAAVSEALRAAATRRIGRPFPSVRLEVVVYDPSAEAHDRWRPAGLGEVGEIRLSGAQLGDDGTAAHFTGDIARVVAGDAVDEQSIELLGRLDNQVKLHGRRTELEPIEAMVLSCGFADAAIAMVTEAGQLECAVAVPAIRHTAAGISDGDGRDGSPARRGDGLRQAAAVALELHTAVRLPRREVPTRFWLFESLPTAPSGKTDRRSTVAAVSELRKRLGDAVGDAGDLPCTKTERTVATVWAEVLGISRAAVGRDSSLFELGGDSLTAMRIVRLLRSALAPDDERWSAPALLGRVYIDGKWITTHDSATATDEPKEQDYDDARTGRIRGVFAAARLIERPVLRDYAAYIEERVSGANAFDRGGCGENSGSEPVQEHHPSFGAENESTEPPPSSRKGKQWRRREQQQPPPVPIVGGVSGDRCLAAMISAARAPAGVGIEILRALLASGADPSGWVRFHLRLCYPPSSASCFFWWTGRQLRRLRSSSVDPRLLTCPATPSAPANLPGDHRRRLLTCPATPAGGPNSPGYFSSACCSCGRRSVCGENASRGRSFPDGVHRQPRNGGPPRGSRT